MLGDYLCARKNFFDDQEFINIKTSRFQPKSLFKFKTFLKQLNWRKPLCLCGVPAWALKDCLNIIAEPLTFLINAFLAAEKFPRNLKLAYITVPLAIYKNGYTADQNF